MTKEQDVVAAKTKIAQLKAEYLSALQKATQSGPESVDYKDVVLACQQSGAAYFNFAEEFVGNSDLLGAHRSSLWAQGFAEDCAEILRTLPAHVNFLKAAFSRIRGLNSASAEPGPTAYANMQRMTMTYLSSDISKELKRQFKSEGLPTYGFTNEAKHPMNKTISTILAFVFGVIFVIALLAIAWNKPDPSDFQYTVFRTVLAIAVAGVAAVMPGFIELKIGKWLLAGGTLAVFSVVYFLNPATQILKASEPSSSTAAPSLELSPPRALTAP